MLQMIGGLWHASLSETVARYSSMRVSFNCMSSKRHINFFSHSFKGVDNFSIIRGAGCFLLKKAGWNFSWLSEVGSRFFQVRRRWPSYCRSEKGEAFFRPAKIRPGYPHEFYPILPILSLLIKRRGRR